jgi:predicted DsbA family dithiol-disulfide isomerase
MLTGRGKSDIAMAQQIGVQGVPFFVLITRITQYQVLSMLNL